MAEKTRTLILVKPDAFERGLTGEVLARFERKGLRIARPEDDDGRARRSPTSTTPSTPTSRSSASWSSSSPAARWSPIVLEGVEAVKAARQLIGATNPVEAAPGSIRGDFGTEVTFNMVHGSDSDESAEREIAIWFPELELSACIASRPVTCSSSSPRPRRGGARCCGCSGSTSRSWCRRRGADRRATPQVELRPSQQRTDAAQGRGPAPRSSLAGRGPCGDRSAPTRDVVRATDVVLGKPGKPRTSATRANLERLSGRTHQVLSGVWLVARRG